MNFIQVVRIGDYEFAVVGLRLCICHFGHLGSLWSLRLCLTVLCTMSPHNIISISTLVMTTQQSANICSDLDLSLEKIAHSQIVCPFQENRELFWVETNVQNPTSTSMYTSTDLQLIRDLVRVSVELIYEHKEDGNWKWGNIWNFLFMQVSWPIVFFEVKLV